MKNPGPFPKQIAASTGKTRASTTSGAASRFFSFACTLFSSPHGVSGVCNEGPGRARALPCPSSRRFAATSRERLPANGAAPRTTMRTALLLVRTTFATHAAIEGRASRTAAMLAPSRKQVLKCKTADRSPPPCSGRYPRRQRNRLPRSIKSAFRFAAKPYFFALSSSSCFILSWSSSSCMSWPAFISSLLSMPS